jgi:uncharacterized Zn ribbon protein
VNEREDEEILAEVIIPSKVPKFKIPKFEFSVKIGWYKGDKKNCKSCGTSFILEKDSQFYCTDECYFEWTKMKQERSRYKFKICEICGKEYKPTGGRQKYCAQCGLIYWREDALKSQMKYSIIAEEKDK